MPATHSKTLNILLIKPKARLQTILGLEKFQRLEPLELGYLAAMVPEHSTQVLDLRLHRFENIILKRRLRQLRPDVVGITGYSHESTTVKAISRLVKQLLPDTRIIVGGHHATVAPEDYNIKEIDGIVRGEGTRPFRDFVHAVAAGTDLVGIPGVIPTGNNFPESTAWPKFPDPEELPVPNRELWNYRDYYCVWTAEKMPRFHTVYPPVAMLRTSWGCKMRCTFCIVPYLSDGTHRPNTIERIVDEIEGVKADHIYFSDDENFLNPDFAMDLANAIERRGIKKRYFAWARATTVLNNKKLIEKWRDIGLDGVFVGFEFIDNKELKEHKKATTVAHNERALHYLRSIGIVVHAAFILRPEYTLEKFRTLQKYVKDMPPSQCSFTVISPSPGTPDYTAIKPDIWIDNPYDYYDCMHPLTPTKLPLKQFCSEYSILVREGTAKTPLRVNHHIAPLKDMIRIIWADINYRRVFRNVYQDYPVKLWQRKFTLVRKQNESKAPSIHALSRSHKATPIPVSASPELASAIDIAPMVEDESSAMSSQSAKVGK